MGRGVARALVFGTAALLALSLAGCGRRGGLEPPPDPTAPVVTSTAPGAAGAFRRPKPVPIKPPQEPFVLDPLL